jgi:hypothetical protein
MYKLIFNEQQQVIGFGTVYEQQEGDVIFLEQDLSLVREYLKHNPNADTLIQLANIQEWLKAHDYIINKHLLGEYKDNDKRWTDYLQERKEKLEQYNALEVLHIDKEPFDLTLLTPVDDVVDDVVEQVVDDVVDEVIEQEPIDTFMENIMDGLDTTESK